MNNLNISEGSDNQDDKTVFGMDNSDITGRDFPTEGTDLDQLHREVASYLRDGTDRLITIARNDPSVNADTILSINSKGLQLIGKMNKAQTDKIHDQVTSPANPTSDTEESEVKTFSLPSDMVDKVTAFKSELDAFLTKHSQAQD